MKRSVLKSVSQRLKSVIKNNIYIYNAYKAIYIYIKKKSHQVFILDYKKYNSPNNSKIYSFDSRVETSFPPNYLNSSSYHEEERILSEVNIFQLQDATVIGGSNIILLSDKLGLYNHNSSAEVNHSDGALHDFRTEYRINQETIIYESRKHKRIKVELGISFCINFNFNYYHFVFECLSKFYILEKANIKKDIPIIIDSTARDIIQFKDLIEIFNKDNRNIIYVDRLQYVDVKNLFIITPIHYLPANYIDFTKLKSSSYVLDFECLKYLRKIILNKIDTSSNDCKNSKKIFISRRNNKNRTYNNDEIEEFLKIKGYHIVYPELLSFEEQVKIFHNAEIIIGATGAALTNIIFCRPKTKIIVLVNTKFNISIFSNLAACFGLEMIYFTGKTEDVNNLHASFKIDIVKLNKIIESVI